RARDGLVVRLGDPVRLGVPGDDGDRDTRAGQVDPTRELLNGARLDHVRPDLRGDLRGENDARRRPVDVDASHAGSFQSWLRGAGALGTARAGPGALRGGRPCG